MEPLLLILVGLGENKYGSVTNLRIDGIEDIKLCISKKGGG